jgi:hypothetical protein
MDETVAMAFKKRAVEATLPSNPEHLYPLRRADTSAPKALWLHQGDVLRTWHANHRNATDVAIELPTGAGKTLVGGLIGEFQRQTSKHRVAYICTNNQLARQSYEKLISYGIPAVLLTGRTAEWNRADRARYSSGEAIAVSIYHHVFNSRPALADAEYLVLDDAHAAEGTVVGPWSIEISREFPAYRDVLAVVEEAFDPLVASRLRQDTPEGQFASDVYLASPVGVAAVSGTLETAIQTAVATNTIDPQARYALQSMEGHLGRCLIYASYRRLQIRPFIAPTQGHPAFEAPAQRLYLGATLGDGGELERSFGRRKIDRIPLPEGWDRKGTGRRFFCFPELTTDLSSDPSAVDGWISDLVKASERTIVLSPDTRSASRFERECLDGIGIVHATDIEHDLTAFTGKTDVALVLANRYDGIDLPDSDCRLAILDGLPARGDLQERFLIGSLGAMEVLQERIRARIVQGSGRATRNANDFAAVLMLGDELTAFCTRKEVRAALLPEVNAEVSFGLDNSLGTSSQEMRENLDTFFAQNAEWQEVDVEIEALRDETEQKNPPGTEQLGRSAAHEVIAYQAYWQGDLERALENAKRVIDSLSGGRAPQRYAALWNYLAASWSALLADGNRDESMRLTSSQYFRAARACGRGTMWLSHLASPAERDLQSFATEQTDPLDLDAAKQILASLSRLGGSSFDNDVIRMRSQLAATAAIPYEEALVFLGHLSGTSDSDGNHGATAAPDASWIFGSRFWVTWEAKSEAQPSGELGAKDVQQAGAHLRYVADKRDEAIPSGSIALIMAPQQRVHSAAHSIAEDHTYLVRSDFVLDLFDRLIRAWRTLRTRGAQSLTQVDAISILQSHGALPSIWIPQAMQQPLARTRMGDR